MWWNRGKHRPQMSFGGRYEPHQGSWYSEGGSSGKSDIFSMLKRKKRPVWLDLNRVNTLFLLMSIPRTRPVLLVFKLTISFSTNVIMCFAHALMWITVFEMTLPLCFVCNYVDLIEFLFCSLDMTSVNRYRFFCSQRSVDASFLFFFFFGFAPYCWLPTSCIPRYFLWVVFSMPWVGRLFKH